MCLNSYFRSPESVHIETVCVHLNAEMRTLVEELRSRETSCGWSSDFADSGDHCGIVSVLSAKCDAQCDKILKDFENVSADCTFKSDSAAEFCSDKAKSIFRAAAQNQQNLGSALAHFGAAIRLSNPENKEFLAFQYGNRCLVFVEMKLFEEAKKDARLCSDLIKAIEVDSRSSGLIEFEAKLYEKLKKAKCGAQTAIETSFADFAQQVNQSVAAKVGNRLAKLVDSPDGYGRRMVALRNIKPGEVVLAEKPFVSVIADSDQMIDHCDFCASNLGLKSFVPCHRCRISIYCDSECRKNAWHQFHRIECHIRSGFIDHSRNQSSSSRLGLRTALKRLCCAGHQDEAKEISELTTNIHLRTDRDLMERCVGCYIYVRFVEFAISRASLPSESRQKLFDLIFKSSCMVGSNAHRLVEVVEKRESSTCSGALKYEVLEKADGLFRQLSMFNHSCFPNITRCAVRNKDERYVCIVACRPIKSGEQLFDCYGHLFVVESVESRRRELKKQYLFDCECEACLNQWEVLDLENIFADCQEMDKMLDMAKFAGNKRKKMAKLYKTFLDVFSSLNGIKSWLPEYFDGLVDFIENAECAIQQCGNKPWPPHNLAIELFTQVMNHANFVIDP